MFKKLLIFLFLICIIISAYSQQNRPRLAILPITGGTGDDGETIAELFSFEPEIIRVFVPIPRTSSIDAIMREQQFQSSTGLTDSDTIARLGRQANADYVVAGHIQVLGGSKLVIITIIHVESLQQIAGDYRQYTNIEEIQSFIPDMARRIAQAARINRTNLPRLAVLPFAIPAQGVNQSDAEVLAQLLATEVANSGRYAVLPRTSQIQTVMREHEIQRSGLTEESSIRRIGSALNAQYVLAGNVRRLGQNNMFTAQILEVESASLLAGHAENYSSIGDGLTLMASLSTRLTGPAAAIAVAPAATPAPRPTPAPTPANQSTNILSANVEWSFSRYSSQSGLADNIDVSSSFRNETIQNRNVEVMSLLVDLPRASNVRRSGDIMTVSASIVQRLRTATGVRFKVLGDGGRGWYIAFPITQTANVGNYHQIGFSAPNGRVVEINIPFSRLVQTEWGARVQFNRNNIHGMLFQRAVNNEETFSGSSTIKIFDFEIY